MVVVVASSFLDVVPRKVFRSVLVLLEVVVVAVVADVDAFPWF